jgi:DNA repair protein RecN (Recombination protein N)
MLTSLHIKNVVLIDQLSLAFGSGLSALTGETGAGKSILLDSLGLALGARAESGLVRSGTDQASVTASFDLPAGHSVDEILLAQGMEPSGGSLILRRSVGADGRSRAYANDAPISARLLKEIGEALVDIHGQFETYGLLNPATHRHVLDLYAGNGERLVHLRGAYEIWAAAKAAITNAKAEAARALENEAWLRKCVEELENLAPEEGEEAGLIETRRKLQNREAIVQALSEAAEKIGGEKGADMQVSEAWRGLQKNADKIGEGVDEALATLDRAAQELQEASRQIETLLYALETEGETLETIEDRLYALRGLARKHGVTCEELSRLRQDLGDKLKLMDHQDHVLAKLNKEEQAARLAYQSAAFELRKIRQSAAKRLDIKVQAELAPLKLEKARFSTSIEPIEDDSLWGLEGADQIQFLVSTNAGTEAGPLHKIASGGEMARFMLALKVVLAEEAPASGVYVFDEIDTGIGGATASAVGERLARLAERHQVLVVTHSPQVAALACHHWVVSKSGGKTTVTKLDMAQRREEIARMLAGSTITEEARAAASKLLEST